MMGVSAQNSGNGRGKREREKGRVLDAFDCKGKAQKIS